jgi:hypothetical protein
MTSWGKDIERLPADYEPHMRTFDLTDGESRLSFFGTDNVPRLHHHYLVLDGRSEHDEVEWYPGLEEPISAKTSLKQICKEYPNHVSGTMLLVFDAAGWKVTDMWREMPDDFKDYDPLARRTDEDPEDRKQSKDASMKRKRNQYSNDCLHLYKMLKRQKAKHVQDNLPMLAERQQSLLSSCSKRPKQMC